MCMNNLIYEKSKSLLEEDKIEQAIEILKDYNNKDLNKKFKDLLFEKTNYGNATSDRGFKYLYYMGEL